jgi:hypothetical protein
MRQVTATAKKSPKKLKTSEVRIRPLSNGTFLVAHHQEPDADDAGPNAPFMPPVETGHQNWKEADKYVDGIFGVGSNSGGATADAANAPMPAEPDAGG